jgi:hypothetical protein
MKGNRLMGNKKIIHAIAYIMILFIGFNCAQKKEIKPLTFTIGDPNTYSVIKKAYENGLDWGKVPKIAGYKDARILRLYADWVRVRDKLDDECHLASTGEDWGFYGAQLEIYVGVDINELPVWYDSNKGYIYWDETTNKFCVDANAKKNGTPIDPYNKKILTATQIEEMNTCEKEMDELREAAYEKRASVFNKK